MEQSMKIWLVVLAMVAACGTSDRTTDGFSAEVVGPAVPAQGTVIVGWIARDQVYKFGEGASTGGHYTLSLPGAIPTGASQSDGFAFGVVALIPKGTQIPDGPFDGNSVEGTIIGGADGGLVFRAASSSSRTGWVESFPVDELSCARCVHTSNGDNEELTPIPCEQLAIDTSPDAQGCNVF
jgi:hypothetical protein